MVLTVVVVSLDQDSGADPDLRSELSLVRSAALYADRVVFFSPSERASSVEYTALQGKLDPDALLERLRRERPDLAARFSRPGGAGLFEGMVARAAEQHMPGSPLMASDSVNARASARFASPGWLR